MSLRATRSLKAKLIYLTLGVSLGVLLLAGGLMYFFESRALHSQKLQDLSIFTRAIAANSSAAVLFNDKKSAEEVLSALSANPEIQSATIFRSNGEVFASYTRRANSRLTESELSNSGSARFQGDSAFVSQPIVIDGDWIGNISVVSSRKDIERRLREMAQVSAWIFLFACIVAWLLASWLQRIISAPILHLATVAKMVSEHGDYSLRAAELSHDEIGVLISSFNQMLAETERRDRELQQAHDGLENRVRDRTQELVDEIVERAKIEDALVREQQQLKDLIRTAPVSIAMFDTKMHYLVHSEQWINEFQLSGKEILGRSHYEVFPHIPARWREIYARALAGERQSFPEDSFELSPGQTSYLRWAIQPWYRPEGQQGGVLIVAIRIDELVKARESALRVAQMKSQFLANMSHELRTPLNGIVGFSEILLESAKLPDHQREQLDTIRSSSQLLLTLINDILDFSKIESQKLQLERIPFNLRDLVGKSLAIMSSSALTKGLCLALQIDEQVPAFVSGDQIRLQQVLVNLIGNAIKFTDSGDINIAIKIESAGQDSLQLLFSVQDRGIGIPKDKLGAIFEAFSQADGSTTRRFGGTGLGLAISSKLVAAMGGEIRVDSTVGLGSIFYFTTEFGVVTPAELSGQIKENRSKLPDAQKTESVRKLRILVAEDNVVNQKLINMILERQGHKVSIVENGREALDRIEQETFDIVLMDLQMPVMSGIEAVEALRKGGGVGSLIPVVALTAHVFPEDKERCIAAGMDEYLSKPIDRTKLFETLQRLTDPQKEGPSNKN